MLNDDVILKYECEMLYINNSGIIQFVVHDGNHRFAAGNRPTISFV